MGKLKELGISFIRTSLVPPAAGFIGAWLLKKGITIEATWVFTAVSFVFSAIWYVVLRAIEIVSVKPWAKRWAGILLGAPYAPVARRNY